MSDYHEYSFSPKKKKIKKTLDNIPTMVYNKYNKRKQHDKKTRGFHHETLRSKKTISAQLDKRVCSRVGCRLERAELSRESVG